MFTKVRDFFDLQRVGYIEMSRRFVAETFQKIYAILMNEQVFIIS